MSSQIVSSRLKNCCRSSLDQIASAYRTKTGVSATVRTIEYTALPYLAQPSHDQKLVFSDGIDGVYESRVAGVFMGGWYAVARSSCIRLSLQRRCGFTQFSGDQRQPLAVRRTGLPVTSSRPPVPLPLERPMSSRSPCALPLVRARPSRQPVTVLLATIIGDPEQAGEG